MDGDADLKRRTGAGMVCVPPLVYLWDPGEVDPPAAAGLEISNFQIFGNLDILVKPIPNTRFHQQQQQPASSSDLRP